MKPSILALTLVLLVLTGLVVFVPGVYAADEGPDDIVPGAVHAGESAAANQLTNDGTPDGAFAMSSFAGFVDNEIVVKFDPEARAILEMATDAGIMSGLFELDELNRALGVDRIRKQFPWLKKKRIYKGKPVDLAGWYMVRFQALDDVLEVVAAYRRLPFVIDAQPIGLHRIDVIPDDPEYLDGNQWHLDKIQAPAAWEIESGNSAILVGIADTGVRYYHDDLGGSSAVMNDIFSAQGNMWRNPNEVDNGIDDDGNGKADDRIGWDFVTNAGFLCTDRDCRGSDNNPKDFNGHGTHVAGIAGAITNNNAFVAGTAGGGFGTSDGIRIVALRIGYQSVLGGLVNMAYAARALNYASEMGVKIFNASWGSSNSGALNDAVQNFLATGGLIFHAAGNSSSSSPDFLGRYPDDAVINVAATNQNDTRASFSNYGPWVDVSAPGVNILSTVSNGFGGTDTLASYSGTSMASPMAAAVAALIWSQDPTRSAMAVRDRLLDTADPLDSASGLGAGRINALAALQGDGEPAADFEGSPTTGCGVPLTVTFTDRSSGEIQSWEWDFGDSATSNLQHPTHDYLVPGVYDVSLKVTGSSGSDTAVKAGYIQVLVPPVAAFTGDPASGYAPLTVGFADQSSGNPTSWDWQFGDGGTDSGQNLAHTFTEAGTYTITLKVANVCGADTATRVDYIRVLEPSEPAVHVDLVQVSRRSSWFWTRGRALVRIVDPNGQPVDGAVVIGKWSGGAGDTDQFTTDSAGEGIAFSNWTLGRAQFTFCVANVVKSGFIYDESANRMTCDSN